MVLKLLSENTLQKQTTEQILSKEKLAGFFFSLLFSWAYSSDFKANPRKRHVCADQHVGADHEDDRDKHQQASDHVIRHEELTARLGQRKSAEQGEDGRLRL